MKKKTFSIGPYNKLPDEQFDIILADFPWKYYGSPTKWAAAGKEYDCLEDAEILQFPMQRLLSKKAVVFLWTTSAKLDFTLQCIKHWKLHYRGMGFVWIKTKKDGVTPIGAQGVRPSITKPTFEFVVCASTAAKGRPVKLRDESIRSVVLAPVAEHSRKPRAVHDRVSKMYSDAKKLELFAREPAEGWMTWGNQLLHFKTLAEVSSESKVVKPKQRKGNI